MLNRSASLAMSTSLLKALPVKLDIKRHSPSILYIHNSYLSQCCLPYKHLPKAANNQYAFKHYTSMIFQLFMLLSPNILLLNAVISLAMGCQKDLQGGSVYHNVLKPHYISHRIMYVNSIAVTVLPCNSKIY